jgi:hypothetical protein
MSILQQQLRTCLAAIIVVGLLLAGVATSLAATVPCGEGDHHGTTTLSAQLVQLDHAAIEAAVDGDYNLAPCCSTIAASCCAGAAIMGDGTTGLNWPPVGSAWIPAVPSPLDGLGNKVNRHPPRLA